MHPIPGDFSACGTPEIYTLMERWAEEAGGTYVASIAGEPWLFLADVQEVERESQSARARERE